MQKRRERESQQHEYLRAGGSQPGARFASLPAPNFPRNIWGIFLFVSWAGGCFMIQWGWREARVLSCVLRHPGQPPPAPPPPSEGLSLVVASQGDYSLVAGRDCSSRGLLLLESTGSRVRGLQ